MKDFLKKIIKNAYIRKKMKVFIYNIKIFFKKNNKKPKNIYDYSCLLKNKKNFCREIFLPNSYYGISKCLKEYSNYNGKIESCIEHGLYFGDFLNYNESINSGLPGVITFGSKRKNFLILNGSKKIIIEIGPYIYYAKALLSEEQIKKEHNKNGKTLLVFPSHSLEDSTTKYDLDIFMNYIDKIKLENDFKTVLVCLYFRDIELGMDKVYKNRGYKICCSGRREDKDFLARQKTFFLLSDYVISNSVGTHVGYSICLKKPQTIFKQVIEYNASNKEGEKNIINTKFDSFKEQKNEIANVFKKYNEEISDEQIKICNKYWGLNKIRTSKEMHFLLTFCENIAKLGQHNEIYFEKSMKMIYKTLNEDEKKIIMDSNQELWGNNGK